MNFTIKKEEVITYPPEELWKFEIQRYEWIDNLHFIRDPKEFLGDKAQLYIEIVKKRFEEEHWHGDGEIGLLWLPPFLVKDSLPVPAHITKGFIIWHVKQSEDGTSYLLFPPGFLDIIYPG